MMAMDGATMEADAPRRSMMSELADELQLAWLEYLSDHLRNTRRQAICVVIRVRVHAGTVPRQRHSRPISFATDNNLEETEVDFSTQVSY